MAKDLPLIREMVPAEVRLAQMLRALGNPVRFRIMQRLAERQVCITGEIVEFTTLAQSTVSQHLKVLREAGLIQGEVEGPATCYCIDAQGVRFLKDQIGAWLPGCCAAGAEQAQREGSWTGPGAESLRPSAGAGGEAAIARAYLRPEMVVAEVGAGAGIFSARLAPIVRRVYAVDSSPAGLETARQRLGAFDNIEYHQADALSLPFPDESLDAVFASLALQAMPDPAAAADDLPVELPAAAADDLPVELPAAAIREMARVLVPGGRLVLSVPEKAEAGSPEQGLAREQVRGWLGEAGLVNLIVTGVSASEAQAGLFVATGTRRMAMRAAVQKNYGELARSGAPCGCSSSAGQGCCGSEAGGESGCCGGASAQQGCCGSGAERASTGAGGESGCCGGASAQQGCCGSEAGGDQVFISGDYAAGDLLGAPQEAAAFSLGCGNPIALAGLRTGEVALDIGSGGGLDAFLAAARVGPEGRVIGVDMTPAMLERARASAERSGIHNVEFRQGYAEALPVADGSVDVILSNCVINLAEDKGLVFREAFRALRPGGRLEVSDIVTSGALPLELRGDAGGWAECVTGALPEAEYLELIAQAGFEAVTVRRRTRAGQVAGVAITSAVVSAHKP